MKKSEIEIMQIILKHMLKINKTLKVINEQLAIDEELFNQNPQFNLDEDKIVEIDQNTYRLMCELMETGKIAFMGIA